MENYNGNPPQGMRRRSGAGYWWHEMFRAHTKKEYREFFMRGLDGNKDKVNKVYPWMYSRVFAICFVLFALTLFAMTATSNGISYPTVIFLGAIFVELPFLVLIYELNPKCSFNILPLLIVFIAGSAFSIFIVEFSYFLYTPNGDTMGEQFCQVLWTGFIEEICKIIPAIIAIVILKKKGDPMACFAIGAAVGAGFSIVENMGYIFANSFVGHVSVSEIMLVAIVRGVTSFGGHTVWAGFEGWAFGKSKRPFLSLRFYGICLLMMLLHCLWDLGIVEDLALLGVLTTLASFIFIICFTSHFIKKERRAVLGPVPLRLQAFVFTNNNPPAPKYGAPQYYNAYNPANPQNLFGTNYTQQRQVQPPVDDVFSEFAAPQNKQENTVLQASQNSANVTLPADNTENRTETQNFSGAEESIPESVEKEQFTEAEAETDGMEAIPTVAEEIRQSGGVQLDFASVFGDDAGAVFARGQSFDADNLFDDNLLNFQTGDNNKTAQKDKKEESEKEELSERERQRIKYAHTGNVFAVASGLILSVLCLVFCSSPIGMGKKVKTFTADKVSEFVNYVQDGKDLYFVDINRQFDKEGTNYYSYKMEDGKYVEITQEDFWVYYVYDVKQSDNTAQVTFTETNLSDAFIIRGGEKISYSELDYSYNIIQFEPVKIETVDKTVRYFCLRDDISEIYYDEVYMEFVVVLTKEVFYGMGTLLTLSVLGGATLIVGAAGFIANHIKARRFKKDEQAEQSKSE